MHKSDVHVNRIIDSRNACFFAKVFHVRILSIPNTYVIWELQVAKLIKDSDEPCFNLVIFD